MRAVVLAAGILTAGFVVLRRKQKQRERSSRRSRPGQHSSKHQQRQLVHAYPSPFGPAQCEGVSTSQQPNHVAPSSSNSNPSSKLSRGYAYSSLLLLLSLAVAAYTVIVLAMRGQYDLAAAAAVTWLLAAPAVLSLGRRQAAAAAAASDAASVEAATDGVAADATMVITEMQPPTKFLSDFHGTWIKDAAASDSMDAAMRLIHLNALMRQAVKLIRGVQLGIGEDDFTFAVFSAISWFKLGEHYPWTGEVAENRRRDMRRGKSRGQVSISPKGTILLHYTWEHPYSGHATDEFSIDEQDRLRLYTVVNVDGQVVSYTQVYRRKRKSQAH